MIMNTPFNLNELIIDNWQAGKFTLC